MPKSWLKYAEWIVVVCASVAVGLVIANSINSKTDSSPGVRQLTRFFVDPVTRCEYIEANYDRLIPRVTLTRNGFVHRGCRIEESSLAPSRSGTPERWGSSPSLAGGI